MKLRVDTVYAIAIIKGLETRRTTTLKAISVESQLSLHLLEQVARKLRQAELIKSVRGPGGGYILTKELASISFFDVYNIFEKTHNKTEENHAMIKINKNLHLLQTKINETFMQSSMANF